MRRNVRNRRWAVSVGMATGAAFAAALIGLANAPVAGADEGSVADTAVDDLYQALANFFAPEGAGFSADHYSDRLTGEGTALDKLVDGFYQLEVKAFQPEGPIDALFDGREGKGLDVAIDNHLQAIANFFTPEGTADHFSDLLFAEGTHADQMIDAFDTAINTAFQPEGLIDGFLDQMWTVAII